MIKLLCCGSESSSAERLGFPISMDVEGFASDYQNDVVFRWGNSKKVYANLNDKRNKINPTDFPNVINPRINIRTNVNKLLSLEKMSTVVNVPRIFKMEVPSGIKAIIRPFEHSGGSGFQLVTGPYEINWRENYGIEFLDTPTELRCWFINGKTLVGKRVAQNVEQQEQYPCRSKWGYEYKFSQYSKLREQTLAAAQALGLESGASDVLWHQDKYWFLELNSAPSIDTRTLENFYREGINELARRKFPRCFEVQTPQPTVPSLRSIWNGITNSPIISQPITNRQPLARLTPIAPVQTPIQRVVPVQPVTQPVVRIPQRVAPINPYAGYQIS